MQFQDICFPWNANFWCTITCAFFRPSTSINVDSREVSNKFVKSGVLNCLKKEEIFGDNNLLLDDRKLVLSLDPVGTLIKQFILDPEGVNNNYS